MDNKYFNVILVSLFKLREVVYPLDFVLLQFRSDSTLNLNPSNEDLGQV